MTVFVIKEALARASFAMERPVNCVFETYGEYKLAVLDVRKDNRKSTQII